MSLSVGEGAEASARAEVIQTWYGLVHRYTKPNSCRGTGVSLSHEWDKDGVKDWQTDWYDIGSNVGVVLDCCGERTRLQIQAAKMGSPLLKGWGAWNLIDVEGGQLTLFGYLISIPPWLPPWRGILGLFRPWGWPRGHWKGLHIPYGVGMPRGPQEELEDVWVVSLSLLPPQPGLAQVVERGGMDGWVRK